MSARSLAVCVVAATAVGCGDEASIDTSATQAASCANPSGTASVVIARFAFVRADTMRLGVADGFDLDTHVTVPGDSVGCAKVDFTAPDGRRGIDNQLSQLLPVVDSMTGGALDGAIQGAINNGQLLVSFTIEQMENRCNDPDVSVVMRRVAGMPFVGADMLVDPGQTFDLMREAPVTRTRGRVVDRVLTIDRTNIPLPVAVFGVRFILNLYGAQMRMRLDEDGGGTGLIGGGISVAEFTHETESFDIPNSLRAAVGTTMRLVADLDPGDDGRCRNLSAAMALTARPAFVNP